MRKTRFRRRLEGPMKYLAALLSLFTLPCLCIAQDLVINNGRIVDGTGRVIERGSIVVANGRVVAIAEFDQQADIVIDAQGMTVMPGMIDTHVHLIIGPAPDSYGCDEVTDHLDETLLTFLRRGFTTILSAGDPFPDIVALSERIAGGAVLGPRLLAVGPVFSAPNHPAGERADFCSAGGLASEDEETVRAEVRKLAKAGVDGIKIAYDSAWPPILEDRIVVAIVDEAHAHGLRVMAHVQTADDAIRAAELGVDQLAHLPQLGSFGSKSLEILREAGVLVSSTVHLHAPINGPGATKLNHGDREYTPERLKQAEPRLLSLLDNVRTLWDAGIPIAFGTDPYRGQSVAQNPTVHEIETLAKILSPNEVIAALTKNGAMYLDLGDELGTLEPGKLADIVIINGDPLTNVAALVKVIVVIKGGEIVVDNR